MVWGIVGSILGILGGIAILIAAGVKKASSSTHKKVEAQYGFIVGALLLMGGIAGLITALTADL